jgi:RimJ/RimL family protein N-acetyltransferase/8-oxo-dGTP pyrophosphatase MutT (NUDIX family)
MAEEPARTWDGLEIATDHPTGGAVCVRRSTPAGAREVLLLHRSHQGPDFEGDWAWTSPAGCRQPGEPVYPGVLRELAEEAGIEGCLPWAVDLSARWAVFAVDVPYDVSVELVDPEHDRFEWVPPDRAATRLLPAIVADGQAKAAAVPAVELEFRPMVESDFATVARWQSTPHVATWWDARSRDEESVRARYLPRLRGDEPTRMWIVEIDGVPAGFLQDYRVGDHPDYAEKAGDPEAVGFDYAIGDPSRVGSGLGTRLIWEFCRAVLHRDYPMADRLLASPSHRNRASLRALAKCGFTQGLWIDAVTAPDEPADTDIVCTLNVRHWLG